MGPENFLSSGMWIIPLSMMALCAFLFRFAFIQGRSHSLGPNRRQAPGPPGGVEAALEILRERYARGEITSEQLKSMRDDL